MNLKGIMIMPEIWFWQRIISPHMIGLPKALARKGYSVNYVTETEMRAERSQLGWEIPESEGVKIHFSTCKSSVHDLVRNASHDSVHICQGIRANGRIGLAQKLIKKRGLQQWILMETVNDQSWSGRFKRVLYQFLFKIKITSISGILSIGHKTDAWVIGRGVPAAKVFPFTYFLSDIEARYNPPKKGKKFKIFFVGQFVERKRLDLLIEALHAMHNYEYELYVIGAGPLEKNLRVFAEKKIPGKFKWVGRIPSSEIQNYLRDADCLVLPSRHDGWGAVVTESLMVGTPVICSDSCGSAGVVLSSRAGGVFKSGDLESLKSLLIKEIQVGPPEAAERKKLSTWSSVLGAEAGADYVLQILNHQNPPPPWATPNN